MMRNIAAVGPDTTILMVEDDEGHARLIEKNLRRAGLTNELIMFDTGQGVLDYLLTDTKPEHLPDQPLMLLDLNLPEMDGYEVLRRLRANERTRIIPVIILTTTDNPREIRRCYELGCNVYITKPVEYEHFADAIKKLGTMLSIVKLPHGE
jgi:CheY-like chemotaxis protein